jgi:hypothetical protein
LNRNPHVSCREIAKDLFIPKTSILRVLDEMGLKLFVVRWVPYKLSAELKAKRIEICQEVLSILEQLGPRQQNHVIIGDESWIYWDNYHSGQWTADCAAVPPQIHTMISLKKTMISAYFTRQGFVSIEALPETERFNSTFFTETILPSIVQSLIVSRPKMQARGYSINIDRATPHNSGLSLRKTEELGFTRLPQPSYSPDLAPCDFFFFGYLKKELQGMKFRSGNQVISAVGDVLANIPIEMLSRLFDEWIERLHACIATEVEYT